MCRIFPFSQNNDLNRRIVRTTYHSTMHHVATDEQTASFSN
jgi:hypothetical protein